MSPHNHSDLDPTAEPKTSNSALVPESVATLHTASKFFGSFVKDKVDRIRSNIDQAIAETAIRTGDALLSSTTDVHIRQEDPSPPRQSDGPHVMPATDWAPFIEAQVQQQQAMFETRLVSALERQLRETKTRPFVITAEKVKEFWQTHPALKQALVAYGTFRQGLEQTTRAELQIEQFFTAGGGDRAAGEAEDLPS